MSSPYRKRSLVILAGLILLLTGFAIISSHFQMAQPAPRYLVGHSEEVTSLAFSSDGLLLATAGDDQRADLYQGEVQIWDRQTLARQQTLVFSNGVGNNNQVIFSPDGRRIIGFNDQNLTVWDARTGQTIKNLSMDKNFPKFRASCFALFFNKDGALLDCEVDGDNNQIVKLWDRFAGKRLWRFVNGTEVQKIVISPDYRTFAVSSFDSAWHQQVRLLNGQTGKLIRIIAPPHSARAEMQAKAVCFSSDSRLLAMATPDTVLVIDIHTGRTIHTLPFPVRDLEYPNALAFSPDVTHLSIGTNGQDATWSERLAENSHDFGTLSIWNLRTGEVQMLPGYDGGVDSLAYAPDGRILWCNNTMAWDVRDLK